jgi:hypothetical protein
MAKVIPEIHDAELDALPSRAEARLYRALRDTLPDEMLVLFSVTWVTTSSRGTPRDGEADFVVFDPHSGMLVIEVKGGGVSFHADTGEWWSVDSAGTRHPIKDPFRQACAEKHSLLGLLRCHPSWRQTGNRRIAAGHAVFFPDVSDLRPLLVPQRPRSLMGGRDNLLDLPRFVVEALTYWSTSDSSVRPLGKDGLECVRKCFCSDIDVRPLISVRLHDEEERRVRLTTQQARFLRSIGSHVRAAICGGAGTGKTILAMEKAKETAAKGLRTLLLCYNRPLSDWMKRVIPVRENLHVMTFHQLCEWRAGIVLKETGRDLLAEAHAIYVGADRYETHLPHALAVSTDVLHDTYDAMIVDEGQDFSDDYWLPLELLLADPEKSPLYVFYDQNQAVYRETRNFPIAEAPFVLTVNCRNTRNIHEAAYRYYEGEITEPCEIDGAPIKSLTAPTIIEQARLIASEIRPLIGHHRLQASQIVVLVTSALKHSMYDALRAQSLPAGIRWAVEDHCAKNCVVVDTVGRFKGLESAVVFLWFSADLDPAEDAKIIYVGTSRAKSMLYVVGPAHTTQRIISPR